MTQNLNNTSLEDRLLINFGGNRKNDLLHIVGNTNNQIDDLNTLTRSSYIDTAHLKYFLMSNKNTFTVFSLNVQSINLKFKCIYPLMLELNNNDAGFSAMCLQESWLSDDSDLSQYQLPNSSRQRMLRPWRFINLSSCAILAHRDKFTRSV